MRNSYIFLFSILLFNNIALNTLAKADHMINKINLLEDIVIEDKVTSLKQYINRMNKEHDGSYQYYTSDNIIWNTPSSLKNKISNDGKLKPYFGNTLVFTLSDKEKNKLGKIQDRLRSQFSYLSEALSKDKFHLTLHDLFHAKDFKLIEGQLSHSKVIIKKQFKIISEYLKENPDRRFISMRPSMVLPSVNTSIVVNYLPSTSEDYKILFNIYKLFDEIVTLPYFLRAHITLDYFLPKNLIGAELSDLSKSLIELNSKELPIIQLDLLDLSYQLFQSMNEYSTLDSVKNY